MAKRPEAATAVGVAAAAAAVACIMCAGIVVSQRLKKRRQIYSTTTACCGTSSDGSKFRTDQAEAEARGEGGNYEDDSTTQSTSGSSSSAPAGIGNASGSAGTSIFRRNRHVAAEDTDDAATSCSQRYEVIFSTKTKLSTRSEKHAYYDACIANSSDPTLLCNFLRPWQSAFLQSVGVQTSEELIAAHRQGGDVSISNAMCAYCAEHDLAKVDTHSCYVALNGWCMVARGVVRYVKGKDRERTVRFEDTCRTCIVGDVYVDGTIAVGECSSDASCSPGFVKEISIDSSAVASEFDDVSTLWFDESVSG